MGTRLLEHGANGEDHQRHKDIPDLTAEPPPSLDTADIMVAELFGFVGSKRGRRVPLPST